MPRPRPHAKAVVRAGVALGGLCAHAAAQPQGPFVPWSGPMGITQTAAQILARDAGWPAGRGAPPTFAPPSHHKFNDAASARTPYWPLDEFGPREEGWGDAPQVVSPTQNFLAMQFGVDSSANPPDPQGAAGPTQLVVAINGRIKVLDKATGAVVLSVSDGALFAPVTPIGAGVMCPNVRYDPTSQRWFFTALSTNAPSSILIARSDSASLQPASSFTFFSFAQDQASPPGNPGLVADYPSLGIDASALYIGANMHTAGGTFVNTTGFVVNKASVLGPGPIQVTAFRNLLVGGVGPWSPRAVDNPDPSYPEGYFIGVDNASFGLLQIRRITNPGGAPSISGNIPLIVPATTYPMSFVDGTGVHFFTPAGGSSPGPDALDDRLISAQVRRDRITGAYSLVTAHTIQVSSSGVANPLGGRNAARWYQIGGLAGMPTLTQAGTLFDAATANPRSFWMPTAAMTGQGHMAIGCDAATPTGWIACATAGRLASDPAGATQGHAIIVPGAAAYQFVTGGINRWGRYSTAVVDPADDQSIWVFGEYTAAGNTWGVRAARLLAPPPATPVTATPAITEPGRTLDLLITGAPSVGSAFYDTQPGLNRLTVAFSGPGITVNNVTWTDATHATANITIAPEAPAAAHAITVTNPDGQQSVSGTALFTVRPCYPNCDGSSIAPVLNVLDFSCFLNAYATAQAYANCDGSTASPVLNVQDFACFLNAYALGCD